MIYGIGVGPGDPELISRKAERLIREADVIAVPGKDSEHSRAFQIAVAAVPEIRRKEVIGIDMPMVQDQTKLAEAHQRAVSRLEQYADQGFSVAYLVLGDIGIYSSFSYLYEKLRADGYETELVSGVPSFCAATARAGITLAEGRMPIHIYPGKIDDGAASGTVIIMKAAGCMKEVRARKSQG